jgi:tRNA dimethylallyltransferase
LAADKLRIICGPTASGKSAIAMELCTTQNAAIVSADSRQIYCSFNIGTAKPSPSDCARATHYGIDVADPVERFSAARWADEATEWIECAGEIGKTAVIVGGTGLYIDALVTPLFPAPELDPHKREKLAQVLEDLSLPELRRWCGELDPARAHLGRTQLMRAIEIALISGARISDLHARHNAGRGGETSIFASYLLVDPGPGLASRIEARVDDMIASGWADEVRELTITVPSDAPAWKASGYRTMREYIDGRDDLSSVRERIIIETRQYAKRQRTWFRNQLPEADVTHVNPDDSGAGDVVREWWENAE